MTRDAVGRRRQDAAAVHREPLLVALVGDQQHRLLAKHEGRGAAEEMRGHHRRAGRDGRVRSTTEGCWA